MDHSVPEKLLSRLSIASDAVRSSDFIHIFSHYDADGISAAGILAKTLFREGKDFTVTLLTGLTDETFSKVKESKAPCILLADLGASYIRQLENLDKTVVVLDHHRSSADSEKICYVNPHLFGIDGMTDSCGAAVSFLFSITMNEKNWDLSQITFAGITGDRQHINLGMINRFILENAVKKNYIKLTSGSLIPLGNLYEELYLTTDPYISGVSGDAEGVADMMDAVKLSKGRMQADLDENERRKLSTLITLKLLSKNVSSPTMNDIVRSRYYLNSWHMDAETMSDMLNACGRLDLGGIGIGMCMGDERCRIEAGRLNNEYREGVVTAAKKLDSSGLVKQKNIQYFDSSASGYTGILCSIVMNYIGDPLLPTIGINSSGTNAKASARGTWNQLNRGVDLSVAMSTAAEAAGGEGGGHRIASGASFPSGNIKKFIETLDETIGKQISAR